ncbi:hypothetical protein GQ43DRAFT_490500 [Delitschia confertaspora ATCC 74209]|uniref:Uncharacterized protein n=1 Tax=Delitschia confertaspora ATCC 74209 TaxID=1513339 RepID=A0A9P4MRI8_9PLEO|nr:hypothetical protein GQ43DRAFT_490500 [Delitschia confertaspora ATCC 74209]
MIGMLEFPPSFYPLPATIKEPPYVIFQIAGKDVSKHLPTNIPLNMLLHFSSLAKGFLSRPSSSTTSAPQPDPYIYQFGPTHTPFVLMELPERVHYEGLRHVIHKMQTVSRIRSSIPEEMQKADIVTSLRIMRAWNAFGLPKAGCDALDMHVLAMIWNNPDWKGIELSCIWMHYPHDSVYVMETVKHIIMAHLGGTLDAREMRMVRKAIQQDPEKRAVFDRVAELEDKKLDTLVKEGKLLTDANLQRHTKDVKISEVVAKFDNVKVGEESGSTAKSKRATSIRSVTQDEGGAKVRIRRSGSINSESRETGKEDGMTRVRIRRTKSKSVRSASDASGSPSKATLGLGIMNSDMDKTVQDGITDGNEKAADSETASSTSQTAVGVGITDDTTKRVQQSNIVKGFPRTLDYMDY